MSITTKTAWINPHTACWEGDLDDLTRAMVCSLRDTGADRHDVIACRHDQMTLANAATHTIVVPTSEWIYLIVKCVGTCMVLTAGTDYASAAITGFTPIFGTALMPGMALISTKNLTSASIVSGADGTKVDLLVLNVVAPTDPRLL